MKIDHLIKFLEKFPRDLDVKFIKHPSYKPLAFWDSHEWPICTQEYRKDGPKDVKFLGILVEDE